MPMGRDYNEKFIDDDTIAESSSVEPELIDEFYATEENGSDSRRAQRVCKVEVRRKVEEILAEKDYKRRFSDPFDELGEE